MCFGWNLSNCEHCSGLNPATGQRKSSVAYCYNKNHISANTYHKNMNEASLNASELFIIKIYYLYYVG